jgi:hypothetical protein
MHSTRVRLVAGMKKNLLECIFFLHAETALVFCKCELA